MPNRVGYGPLLIHDQAIRVFCGAVALELPAPSDSTNIVVLLDPSVIPRRVSLPTVETVVEPYNLTRAWVNTPRTKGGLGELKYPLLEDLTKKISADYGVLLEAGIALRGLFLIDKDGVVRHATINDLPLGRSVDEALRVIDALQHFETHGEVCPADWKPGKDALNPKKAGEYFEKANK